MEETATGFTEATRKDDKATVQAILGVAWRDLIPDHRHDDEVHQRYLDAWDKGRKLVPDGDDRMYIESARPAGRNLALLKDARGWYYDVDAGLKEITARGIGRNEYAVI